MTVRRNRGTTFSILLSAMATLTVPAEAGDQAAATGSAARFTIAQAPDAQKKDAEPRRKAPAAAPATKQQSVQIPAPELLLLMIRTNIIAVDQANKTNNYSVLRALAGPSMQAMTPEKLGESFADMRSKQIDLAPTIVVTPQLTQQPSITPAGVLQLAGYFPTQPLQVHFQMAMQPVAGYWRLAGLTINVIPPQQAAAPPAKAPEPAKGKK